MEKGKTLFYKVVKGKLAIAEEEDADYALINIHEYNGLQKALRLVRERALQEVKKSTVDKHGYKLLNMSRQRYENTRYAHWVVKMASPYSIKIDINGVYEIILMDLKEHYGYERFPFESGNEIFYELELLERVEAYALRKAAGRVIEEMDPLEQLIEKREGRIVFGLKNIKPNYGSGVYEVEFLATEML